MKSPRYSNWINLMLLIIFVSNLVACTTSLPPPPPIPLPIPDPLDVSGDDLYAIYRKGLITRHIASNGRLLETLALTNIDPELYDNSGYFQFTFSDDSTVPIPIENLRYSWEYTLNESPNHKPILWSPVIAPIKNPGYSNDGYYGVSGQGDNPGYYGGMAVATFSLEAMYGVSPYSLGYARRMIRYFIDSEMWPKNGYILRQSRFYNSNENLNGEPIIRGASAEELLGIMLGIMFYLEAEEKVGNTDLPVYKEVIVLRDKILSRVDGYPKVCVQGYPADPRNYEHKFMLSTDEASFDVSHFAFPLFASKGIVLRDVGGIPCGPVNDFFKLLTGTAGRSATIVNIFGDVFDAYLMYLMSIVLILEGLPDDGSIDKQALARVFMKDFIKAANTSGPDVDNINNNAFWSVVALLVNKYLDPNGNPFDNNPHLEAIWGDEWRAWLRVKEAHTIVANPSSGTMSSGELSSLWQHNLPLMNVAGATTGWSNHNPFHRIGRWFVWKGRFPYYWEQSEWQREKGFPGTLKYNKSWSWPNYGADLSIAEFKSSSRKKFSSTGFLKKELFNNGHNDNQLEGAGLGLLFPRMLLTHIDPEKFPPPVLPDSDVYYQTLPFPGVEPNSPQFLFYDKSYYSKSDPVNGEYKIKGDQDQSLRIVRLGDTDDPSPYFVVAYATGDERLTLTPGVVSNGVSVSNSNGDVLQPGVYLSESSSIVRGRFDKVEIARTSDKDGNEYIVVAERAEEDRGVRRDNHWLRLSLFRVDGFSAGHLDSLTFLDKWVADDSTRDPDSVKYLDLAVFNSKYVAVMFRGQNDKHRIALFELDFTNGRISERLNTKVDDDLQGENLGLTSAYDQFLIYVDHVPDGWRLRSATLASSDLQQHGIGNRIIGEQLLAITTTRPEFLETEYVVAVTKKRRRIKVYSWEVTQEGRLLLRGEFDTVQAEQYSLGREVDWERASISPLTWKGRPGFVIAGKGTVRAVRKQDGGWEKSDKGLKVLYGYIMEDGRPTLESSNFVGSGNSSAMSMLDVAGDFNWDVITAHKTKDDYLMLILWRCKDKFNQYRWSSD